MDAVILVVQSQAELELSSDAPPYPNFSFRIVLLFLRSLMLYFLVKSASKSKHLILPCSSQLSDANNGSQDSAYHIP